MIVVKEGDFNNVKISSILEALLDQRIVKAEL